MSENKERNGLRKLFGSRFRAGSYSAFAAIIVIVIAILANMMVNTLPDSATQLDLTSGSIFTLSEQSKRIASSVSKDVDLYLLASTGYEDDTILRLLNRYADLSGHIRVTCVDPNTRPTFLQGYELSISRLYENSVLVDCGGRYRLVGYDEIYVTDYEMDYYSYSYTTTTTFNGENALTNAIHYVSSDDLPKAYTLTGHGESELPSYITEAMALDNMEVDSLSLMTAESIPEDATAIIINIPASDINEDEAKLLTDWLASGGSIALTTGYMSPDKIPNLLSVVQSMGMTLDEGIVIEADSQMHYPRYPHYLLPDIQSHEITDAIIDGGYYILAPLSQSITEYAGSGAEVTWLLNTSDSSYAKAAALNMTTTSREDGDTDGPFHVAAVSEKGDGKLLWVSSDGFLEQGIDQVVSGANSDLYLNGLNWMGDQTESISIRAKSLDGETLTVPDAESSFWSIVLIGIIPVLLSAFGFIIRIRRKRR
ncbi:MAG: Gldg family protein [Clostridia bacterium]|nr:Gldg family protein [Clostridia bacterium]